MFGLAEHDMKALTGAHEGEPDTGPPCRVVFDAGQRPTEVVGPLLQDEAAALHANYWTQR